MLYFGRKLWIGFLFLFQAAFGRPFRISGSLKSCGHRAALRWECRSKSTPCLCYGVFVWVRDYSSRLRLSRMYSARSSR
nr:MAG TPA: hypothetical protein [Caudoviricetes sp.]